MIWFTCFSSKFMALSKKTQKKELVTIYFLMSIEIVLIFNIFIVPICCTLFQCRFINKMSTRKCGRYVSGWQTHLEFSRHRLKYCLKSRGPQKGKNDDVLVYLFFRSGAEMKLYKVIGIFNIYSSFVRRVPNE